MSALSEGAHARVRVALALAAFAATVVLASCGSDEAAAPDGHVVSNDGGGGGSESAELSDVMPGSDADTPADAGTPQIRYVFVLVKENHTFDSYFTGFPWRRVVDDVQEERRHDGASPNRSRWAALVRRGARALECRHRVRGRADERLRRLEQLRRSEHAVLSLHRAADPQLLGARAELRARRSLLLDASSRATTPGHFTTIAAPSPFYGNADSSKGCSFPAPDRGTVDAYNRDTCNDCGAVDACFDVPDDRRQVPEGAQLACLWSDVGRARGIALQFCAPRRR